MQEIRHNLPVEAAVCLKEVVADFQVVNLFSVMQLPDGLVDLVDNATLGIEVLATGEDSQQEDLRLRELLAQLGDNGGDPVDNL